MQFVFRIVLTHPGPVTHFGAKELGNYPLNRNLAAIKSVQRDALENHVSMMLANLFRPQCVS